MGNPLDITFNEIRDRDWGGEYTTEDATSIGRLIDQAVRALLARRRKLPAWLAAGTVSRDDVIDVVARAVNRVTINPGALASEAEGDYRYELNPLVASGNIWFPDDDLAQITPGGSTSTALGTAHTRASRAWAGW